MWEADYAEHFNHLDDLLNTNATFPERDQARRRISPDDAANVDRLLRRDWDAR